ncbi:MAG: EAL domain-containing protein, partial [Tepidiforma sp.]
GENGSVQSAPTSEALRLRAEAPMNTFLTVNLDPSALEHEEVARLLLGEQHLGGFIIELTEHTPIADLGRLNGLLERLRERGALIAVDDTGTGYADLRRLIDVRPEFVKVDQGFVTGIGADPARQALVELVGHLASRLDAWVIAEGIETEADLREVLQLGVPLGQGYFLNRPAPAFEPTPAPVREAIARLRPAADGELRAGAFAEPVATAPLASAFEVPDSGTLVLLDAWGRPARMWHLGRQSEPLRVTPACRAEDVLKRALTRPAAERFDPIIVTDEDGRPLGQVRVERLVQALTREGRAAAA